MENTKVGPFLILKRLGTSRRQQVFHARQEAQNRDVVLKFITLPPSIEWENAIGKLERETNELRKLKHDNLVRIYGVGVDEPQKRVFFATELIEGEPLSAILSRRGKLAPDLVVEYGHQIAEALKYIHSKEIIHSKLTPEKILITPDHQVKITDLRLNRAKKRRWDATRQRDLEIAAYMAPEQFDEGSTQKSDFYSLGVILFELLAGHLPYEPDTIGRMAKTKKEVTAPSVAEEVMNCPIWLDKIVTQMVDPNPRNRPHSARAITFAFEEIKKIDATQKSAASQFAGNFNPLTAGTDKTEAKKALGKKVKAAVVDDTPFYKKTPFMAVSLVVILAAMIYFIIPPPAEKQLEKWRAAVESPDPAKWDQATSNLSSLLDHASPEIAEQAESLFYRAKGKLLDVSAKSGLTPAARNLQQSQNVVDYVDAVQSFLGGERKKAKSEFERLVRSIDPDGKERHIHSAAAKKLQQLTNLLALPTDPKTLSAMIAQYATVTNELELLKGKEVLARIIAQFGRQIQYREVVSMAKTRLAAIEARLAGEPIASDDNE